MGGGPEIQQRNLTDELGETFGAFRGLTLPAFRKQWFNKEPLLRESRTAALAGLEDIPELQGPLKDALAYLAPIIKSGGALTGEGLQKVTKDTLGDFASRGNAVGNQAWAANLLNREDAQWNRFNTALSGALGTTAGVQDVTSRAIAPALSTEQTATGTFATLLNPLLSFASNLFEGNQNAAAAESIAGGNKAGGTAGGVAQLLGSVISAIPWSDRRLKSDVKPTRIRTRKGVKLSTWRYKAGGPLMLGPIAQEVEKILPDAVFTDPRTGLKRVNLLAAEAPMMEVAA
jgi:Chaperone of endosialidase